MPSNHVHVIETQGLSKVYGDTYAVNSLDLRVPKNSIFGFLGPNGAGKTTTMKLLLGINRPTHGSGRIFGLDIVADSIAIRQRTGYLAQQPHFYGHMTARQILHLAADFYNLDNIPARIDDSLQLVGLVDKADRPVKHFSGGERQRLGIAQAQIHDPDLLILDEPAAALDPMGRRDVLNIMRQLREKATIFYSTHILDDVQRVSDTVAILNNGSLVAQAPVEQLLAGREDTVYTLHIEGDERQQQQAKETVCAQAWVTALSRQQPENGVSSGTPQSIWYVTVSDDDSARTQLLRLVLENTALNVSYFGRKQYELEDIFMHIVGEGEPVS